MNDSFLFIKTGKKEHMEKLFYDGEVFFNPAKSFMKTDGKSPGVYDRWDSHTCFNLSELYIAEVFEDSEERYRTGEPRFLPLTENALIYETGEYQKHLPIFCVRTVPYSELNEYGLFRLSQETYSRIRKEFPEHDTFVMMLAGSYIYSLKQNIEGYELYGDYVRYGTGKTVPRLPQELQVFSKSETYAYQQEYRFILPKEQFENGKIIHIKSISEMGYGTIDSIDKLAHGFIFAETKEILYENVKKLNERRRK